MSEQQQIVKRKNIGEETLRESRIETENEKVERLSETIFMLMLELEGTRSRLKKWERKGLEQTELIDGSIPPNEKNQIETLMSENAALRVQLDKMANLEIENAYFKENYTKLEELYTHEQRKSRRLEERMEEYGSNDISRMEQVFEGKMQFTRVEETSHRVEHTETTERTEIVERTDRVGTFYVQPETLDIKGGSEGSEGELQDISLLSKNIQRKVRKEPGQYNINANQLEREVYILSQEVDRLNQENQKLIEQNFILVRRQRQAGLEEPEFVSEHFHSGGGLSPRAKSGNPGSPDEKDRLDPFNNEMRPHDISADMRMADLVSQPSEILVPGKEGGGFPALLSNDGTLMLREKIKKLEEEIDDYAGTIRRLEKSNRELEKRNEEVEKENVKLRQSAQTAMRLSNVKLLLTYIFLIYDLNF